ncbi:MAG: ATP-dependent Zn protease [Candidatus Phytoplasma cynodontis]|nr:MAG: ATP-dependent Zn protease [Candidatus Phytoplasma cynodontis]
MKKNMIKSRIFLILIILLFLIINIYYIKYIVNYSIEKNNQQKLNKNKIEEILKEIINNNNDYNDINCIERDIEEEQVKRIVNPIIKKNIENQISDELNSLKKDIKQNKESIKKYRNKIDNLNSNNEQNSKNHNLSNKLKETEKYSDFHPDTIFFPKNKKKFIPYEEIIGMQKEKEALEEFLDYLQNTENYSNEKLGVIDNPKGVILYGCPGTGKTLLARSLSLKAGDQVSFYEIASPEFSCSYLGESPQKVRNLFRDVRNNNKKPNIKASIIFLDECEEIFKNLSNLGENSNKDLANIVNQFKIELTSTENDPNKPILIIGATNHFNQLDEAIKSRFDYHIEVKTLNENERKIFLETRIKQRKNNYNSEAFNYLIKDINAKIEKFSEEKKANRVLEQLLNAIIRNTAKNKRNIVLKEDIQKAFEKIYNFNN